MYTQTAYEADYRQSLATSGAISGSHGLPAPVPRAMPIYEPPVVKVVGDEGVTSRRKQQQPSAPPAAAQQSAGVTAVRAA